MEKKTEGWGAKLGWLSVGALLTLAGSLVYFYITEKQPVLEYEVFPPAAFTSGDAQTSIHTIRVENAGSAEAEDVFVIVRFEVETEIEESSVQPSELALVVESVEDSQLGSASFSVPLMNPGESVGFSFLARGSSDPPRVSVRGTGVTGILRRAAQGGGIDWLLSLVVGASGVLAAAAYFMEREAEQIKREAEQIKRQSDLLKLVKRVVGDQEPPND